ncbi:MAG TPA: pyridoxal-phosphate dependent enzyme [Flavobacteriaceae bacterium]|nr:pyridoxal-phosphate dependent enzyme [Flavobacteriaceae bacterium]
MISKVEHIDLKAFGIYDYFLSLKREDLIHPTISGNKFRKLKYNLGKARKEDYETLLTFGGAYSNHLFATAAAGKEFGFKTIGIVRGEELEKKFLSNPTLNFCYQQGMQLVFISREQYKRKEETAFIRELQVRLGPFYLIPEGGTNAEAVKGCEEILNEDDKVYNYICLALGTGGTMAGIINAAREDQEVCGFSALNSDYQQEKIRKFSKRHDFKIFKEYSFGGYGKIDPELIRFMNDFKRKTNIALDPVYTGKMVYGVFDQMKNKKWPKNSKILAIHTGGLQGISGMNDVLRSKKLELIE